MFLRLLFRTDLVYYHSMIDHNHFVNELLRIIQGALRLDIDKVRNYTDFLADNLEKEGEEILAKRLRKLLEESDRQIRPTDAEFANFLPVDSESRFHLIEIVDCPNEPPLILADEQWEIVHEFASVAKSYAQIDNWGYDASLSLVVHGPPGTGKNRLVRYLARELGLDLYIARLDGLISSYLGSTAKNIRAIFEFAAKRPCVLFLDEFDAIAKLRGDSQELGELKRVVNSFIQNLDTIGRQSIVVAATNHEELLDAAIWRRFSYRIELTLPDERMRHHMWINFSQPIEFTKRELALLVDLSDGFSGSDIHDVCVRLNRYGRSFNKPPSFNKVFLTIQNMSIGETAKNRVASQTRGVEPEEVAYILRTRNPQLYSLSALAHILGVSKAKVHRWTLKRRS